VRCEVAFEVGAELGEGALWDWRHGLLVSVDLLAGRLLLSDPGEGTTRSVAVGQAVGAAMLQNEHELLLAVRDGFASIDLDTDAITRRDLGRVLQWLGAATVRSVGRADSGDRAARCAPDAACLRRR
jgi:sugar lactone lactonase YvrE